MSSSHPADDRSTPLRYLVPQGQEVVLLDHPAAQRPALLQPRRPVGRDLRGSPGALEAPRGTPARRNHLFLIGVFSYLLPLPRIPVVRAPGIDGKAFHHVRECRGTPVPNASPLAHLGRSPAPVSTQDQKSAARSETGRSPLVAHWNASSFAARHQIGTQHNFCRGVRHSGTDCRTPLQYCVPVRIRQFYDKTAARVLLTHARRGWCT
jgi:hypothetical protein